MTAIPAYSRSKPDWLKKRLPSGPNFGYVSGLLQSSRLHTVCEEAKCPNQGECFSSHTATFLIMGSKCSRNCRFCAIEQGPEGNLEPDEPERISLTAARLGLLYIVVTSVTRDDIPDGGASHFAATIKTIQKHLPDIPVEVLIPDFQGDLKALEKVIAANPAVINHNLETVPRLYKSVRPEAIYRRSLALLGSVRTFNSEIPTKSGLMLGLGETDKEVYKTLQDLLNQGCSILTLGQYLQPTARHLPVSRYLLPEEFHGWQKEALGMGFKEVASGPLVRSSYRARELYLSFRNRYKRFKRANW